MAHKGFLALTLLSLNNLVFAAGSTCFFPNGAIHDLASPCDPDADVSFCCEGTHTCLSNKVCWDTQNNHIIRGSCTDSSFPDACGDFCLSESDGTLSGRIADMRQCNGQNADWVCSMDVTDCTDSFELPFGFVQDFRVAPTNNILADGPTSSGATSVNTETSVLTVTVTAASSSGPQTQESAGAGTTANVTASDNNSEFNSTALAAGLGVGLPLLLLLLVCGWLLLRARKVIRDMKAGQPHGYDYSTQPPPQAQQVSDLNIQNASQDRGSVVKRLPQLPQYEVGTEQPRHELDGLARR